MAKKSGSEDGPSRQERAAAIRDAEARKQRAVTLTIGTVTAVIVIVIGLVVAKSVSGSPQADPRAKGRASAAVVKAIQDVPLSEFNTVGDGGAFNPPKKTSGTPLTADGKPRVLYVGAEYCPFCAAERWALAVALSRFGTLTNLGQTASASDDSYPNTNTLSFHGATYSSKFLSFTGYEQLTRTKKPLDTLAPADQQVYDAAMPGGGIPFVDIGGVYLSSGASYDPGMLAGMSHAEIAAAIADPTSDVGKAIIGSANVFSAALCKVTGGQPASVCTSSGVATATRLLG